MQMYKVEFHSQKGKAVETGKYLVCAANSEQAQSAVALSLELTPSATRFDVSRVKPSIYELSRSDYTLKENVGSSASDAGDDGAVHEIRASAKVFAYSEAAAVRRFANAIHENASATRTQLPKHINELTVEVDRDDQRVRPSRVEQQSIYKETRMFSGGAARPR